MLPRCLALLLQARDELIDAVCKREMGVYTQVGPAGMLLHSQTWRANHMREKTFGGD